MTNPNTDPPERNAPAEAEEIPIGKPQPTSSAHAAVEELEVEVRNSTSASPEARAVALGVLRLIAENLARATQAQAERVRALLRENVRGDYGDPDFWRGLTAVVRYQLDEARGFVQRRLRGEAATDAWGMDSEIVELVRPFATFLYGTWWRVTSEGLEHVPGAGRALLAANRSGALPWDGAMIATAVLDQHPQPRTARVLYPNWYVTVPLLAPMIAALGQVQDIPANAVRLLEAEQLVCAFPEIIKGVAKPLRDSYRLAAFSGGFVEAALRTSAPIVPVAVVGAEETYPVLADAKPIAQLFNLPFFPITPTFPWLGLLGAVPLPTKWTIIFHAPIATASYGALAASDPQIVGALAQQVRDTIQATLDARVAARSSVFGA